MYEKVFVASTFKKLNLIDMHRIYSIIKLTERWAEEHSNHIRLGFYAFFISIITSVYDYFLPMREIFIVMFVCVVADLITGITAARKQGQGIKSKRMKKTIIKLGLYFGVVALFYAIDRAFEIIDISRHTAWLIVGFEAYSILENMAIIIDHPIFRLIKRFMKDKIKENTGISIDEDKAESLRGEDNE